jgi:tRNA dimethylallyltransferase
MKIHVVCGPTASGKTELALRLAKKLNARLVNADAFQVYKGMNIGTNKDVQLLNLHPTALFNLVNPDEGFTVAQYQSFARELIENAKNKDENLVFVGGTGLYLKATFYDFVFRDHKQPVDPFYFEKQSNEDLYQKLMEVDQDSAFMIHPHNRRRVMRALEVYLQTGEKKSLQEKQQKQTLQYDVSFYAISGPRDELYSRIDQRVETMFEQGLLDEVKHLLTLYPRDSRGFAAIGYKETISYLDGKATFEETKMAIKQATRNYAKRQLTYFKNQLPVVWFSSIEEAKERLL